MNISRSEFISLTEKIRDMNAEGNAALREDVPLAKRMKTSIVVYRWKYVTDSGSTVKDNDLMYLDMSHCRTDGERNEPVTDNDECVLKVVSETVDRPTPESLIEKVYGYLLEREFNERKAKLCYGCLYNRPGQRDHQDNGCLSEKEVLVTLHNHACHIRISTRRLVEACQTLSHYYEIDFDDKQLSDFLRYVDPKNILMTDTSFNVYEFGELDGL